MSEATVEPVAQLGRWIFGKLHGPKDKKEEKILVPVSRTFTDVTFVLDKSSSMQSLREAACQAINDYMKTVDETPGDGCWSLVTFDDWDSAQGAGEVFPHKVFSQVPSEQRPFLEVQNYNPRGMTALRDALALTILETKARVESQVPEQLRSCYRVLMVIMTDGLENQSRQYSQSQLAQLIAERQAAGWVFVYLGANQDAFAVGQGLGISHRAMKFAAEAAVDMDGLTPMRFAGYGTSQTDCAEEWQATPQGLCSATAKASNTARAWKADGNQTAASFVGSAAPDKVQAELKK